MIVLQATRDIRKVSPWLGQGNMDAGFATRPLRTKKGLPHFVHGAR
jgi:hypothetical protein